MSPSFNMLSSAVTSSSESRGTDCGAASSPDAGRTGPGSGLGPGRGGVTSVMGLIGVILVIGVIGVIPVIGVIGVMVVIGVIGVIPVIGVIGVIPVIGVIGVIVMIGSRHLIFANSTTLFASTSPFP